MDVEQIDGDTRYRVSGYGGIAFYYVGREVERYWDLSEDIYPEDPEERETGRVLLVMVGDDREHAIDPEDVEPLADEDYCGSCGQIGCGWG